MHTDLLDAVQWAVKKGVADAKRVGVFGGSYGGYAALASLTFTPETFACAVDIVGPSNLKTLSRPRRCAWWEGTNADCAICGLSIASRDALEAIAPVRSAWSQRSRSATVE